jgi:hypothetical protein
MICWNRPLENPVVPFHLDWSADPIAELAGHCSVARLAAIAAFAIPHERVQPKKPARKRIHRADRAQG